MKSNLQRAREEYLNAGYEATGILHDRLIKELEMKLAEAKNFSEILKLALKKSAERCEGIEKQNEELIKWIIDSVQTSIINWIDNEGTKEDCLKANIKMVKLIEKNKQKPIEEILKEV